MAEHPIQNLMKTAMESIKGMVDVNIIIGNTVETPDGTVIIPVSKVTFGFAAGGGDYSPDSAPSSGNGGGSIPFGGGSGGGVTVRPVGFLVCAKEGGVRFLPVENNAASARIVDMLPWVVDKVGQFLNKDSGDAAENGKKSQCGEKEEAGI